MFEGSIEKVSIRFPDKLVGAFLDRFGEDIILHSIGNNTISVSVDIAVSVPFFGWVLGLGNGVKITAP